MSNTTAPVSMKDAALIALITEVQMIIVGKKASILVMLQILPAVDLA